MNYDRPKSAMELAFERAAQKKHDQGVRKRIDSAERDEKAQAHAEDRRHFLQSLANRRG